MAEVLELEKIEIEHKQGLPKLEKDTWILKLPAEVCNSIGTIVGLTIRNW